MSNPLPNILAEQVAVFRKLWDKQFGDAILTRRDEFESFLKEAIKEAFKMGAEAHWEAIKPQRFNKAATLGDDFMIGYGTGFNDVVGDCEHHHTAFMESLTDKKTL